MWSFIWSSESEKLEQTYINYLTNKCGYSNDKADRYINDIIFYIENELDRKLSENLFIGNIVEENKYAIAIEVPSELSLVGQFNIIYVVYKIVEELGIIEIEIYKFAKSK